MIVFIDSENKLHTENDGTMTEVNVDLDGQSKRVIESYKFYPDKGLLMLFGDPKETFGAQKQFADMAEDIKTATEFLTDEQAETVTALFEFWAVDTPYFVGDRRQYDGLLYRCVQAHTSQEGWEPPAVPALWVRTSTEEWPEWIQPTGAQDAYNTGDKVSHNEKHWISDVDGNVWEPGVYGWSEANG